MSYFRFFASKCETWRDDNVGLCRLFVFSLFRNFEAKKPKIRQRRATIRNLSYIRIQSWHFVTIQGYIYIIYGDDFKLFLLILQYYVKWKIKNITYTTKCLTLWYRALLKRKLFHGRWTAMVKCASVHHIRHRLCYVENKINKEGLRSLNATPTRPSYTWPPARSLAGPQTK
jgi:hypothetical protein